MAGASSSPARPPTLDTHRHPRPTPRVIDAGHTASFRASSTRTPTRCSPATGAAELRRRLAGATYARDRGGRRRDRVDRRGHAARRPRTSSSTQTPDPARRDAAPAARRPARSRAATGSTTRAELKMLRAIDALGAAPDRRSSRRSWARTRSRPSIASARDRYVGLVVEEMIPAVGDRRTRRSGATCSAKTGVFTPEEIDADSRSRAPRRPEAAHPRRRARRERRIAGRGRASAPGRPIT